MLAFLFITLIMRKVVIASDSFKGSLSSSEVAEAVCEAINDVYPSCEVVKLNVADGGEGMIEALKGALDADIVSVPVHDPSGRIIKADYLIQEIDPLKTAIIEMAKASGLTLLEEEERNPLQASSYGTGELIIDAYNKGCRKFIIGIGGSATNDGGTGMLEAMGFRFIDEADASIISCCGGTLESISSIDDSEVDPGLLKAVFSVACDVDAHFTGSRGATYVFGTQKGADMQMLENLERGMISFEKVIEKVTGIKLSSVKGSGAAGGIGGALYAFLGAKLQSGAELVLDLISFDNIIKDADLVITGEGSIDLQTLMGKAPAVIASRAAVQGIPVVAIGGIVSSEISSSDQSGFKAVLPICETPSSPEELTAAMSPSTAKANIRKTIIDFLTQNMQKNQK